MKKGYAELPGGQVHYREEGSGAPVLLLHQTAFDSDEFSDLIPCLSRYCRAIAMDSPGYGMSYLPAAPFEIEDYARTVRDFIRVLGLGKVTLAGHHTGASIAVETAAAYPELVERLVSSGTPDFEPGVRQARLASNPFKPMVPVKDGSHLMEKWNRLRKFMPAAGPRGWNRFVIASLIAGPRGEDGHRAVYRHDIEPRLHQLKCPVLLISGTEDTFAQRVYETRKKVPGSLVKMIPGADPMIAVEQPALLADAILEFMGLKQGV
jgi:pimeloyl-ACP methyl ester carboxylesterase